MKTCLYEGTIRHRRHLPIRHELRAPIFFVHLDLAEGPEVLDGSPWFSREYLNVASFRRTDYLAPHELPLDEAVRRHVEAATGRRPEGAVRMLTHLRYWGHCFNPVTFYYCWSPDDDAVETIVAEITNTPWKERHVYVLDRAQAEILASRESRHLRWRFDKAFHVSPFIDMDMRYDWRFLEPGENLNVHMIDLHHGAPFFDATLLTRRVPFTPSAFARRLLRFPAQTLRILFLIHWNALRLWTKGAIFYVHPRKRRPETEGGDPR